MLSKITKHYDSNLQTKIHFQQNHLCHTNGTCFQEPEDDSRMIDFEYVHRSYNQNTCTLEHTMQYIIRKSVVQSFENIKFEEKLAPRFVIDQ